MSDLSRLNITVFPSSAGWITTVNASIGQQDLAPNQRCKHFECYDTGRLPSGPADAFQPTLSPEGTEIEWPSSFKYTHEDWTYQNIPREAPEFICRIRSWDSALISEDRKVMPLNQNTPTLRMRGVSVARSQLDEDVSSNLAVSEARDKCYKTGTDYRNAQELAWRRWPIGREFAVDDCKDHCDNLYNGTFITVANREWGFECEYHDEVRNRAFLEFQRDMDIAGICLLQLGMPTPEEVRAETSEEFVCDLEGEAEKSGSVQPSCTDNVVTKEAERCLEKVSEEDEEKGVMKGKSREACEEYCEMTYNGTMMASLWECWDEKCKNVRAGRNEAAVDVHLESIVKRSAVGICQPLGINGSKPWIWEEFKTAEKKKEEEKKGDESIASGPGVKKGAVVLAMVVGGLFAGML